MPATLERPLTAPVPPQPRRDGDRSREVVLFLIGVAVLALHVLDDSFIQPQPGTGPGDHLTGGLVPLAVLAAAAWAYPRLRGGRRGALALFLGAVGLWLGIEAAYYIREVGPSGDDFTGLLVFPASLLLIGLGIVTLWRTRRRDDGLVRTVARRAGLGLAGLVVMLLVAVPIGYSYVTTHVGRAVVPADELGVPHEDVSFTTSDGLELKAWYIPSRNGAAVIAFPGRRGPQKPARMLARHGYGVLLFDRRGEGRSEGDPNSWGWSGDRDVKAAIAWLQRRSDVEPGRIGGIGLSVGGEMMIETASETDALAAVVSEGAGSRSIREDLGEFDPNAINRAIGTAMAAVKTASVRVFGNEPVPPGLEDAAARAEAPMLLIAAPNSTHGEELNRNYARAAGDDATLWEIPESRHVGGMTARPREYERRVVGFFDRTLGG